MPPRYSPRIIDADLDELFRDLPAVSLEGPKGVGKTATAVRRASTVLRLDDPVVADRVRADPQVIARARTPLVIDEWQTMPYVWDLVRRAVDDDFTGGRFLLTGSAAPSDAPMHSGAGRIVTLRMRPLSMAEREREKPTVSLAALLAGGADIGGETGVGLVEYVEEIVGSGFPAIRSNSGRTRQAQLDGYLDRVVERDFPEAGLRVRKPRMLRQWLASYAAATATTASYNVIARAADVDGEQPTKVTTGTYRDVLNSLFLFDEVPAWTPSRNSFARLAGSPKHFLADPALAARLLHLDEDRLLGIDGVSSFLAHDGSDIGPVFEALVNLSMQVYAARNDAQVSHFRTSSGTHEVDFIVSRGDLSQVAFEVKLTPAVNDRDVRHLLYLRDKLGEQIADVVIITTGPYAYRRPDGVAVVPLALLGP